MELPPFEKSYAEARQGIQRVRDELLKIDWERLHGTRFAEELRITDTVEDLLRPTVEDFLQLVGSIDETPLKPTRAILLQAYVAQPIRRAVDKADKYSPSSDPSSSQRREMVIREILADLAIALPVMEGALARGDQEAYVNATEKFSEVSKQCINLGTQVEDMHAKALVALKSINEAATTALIDREGKAFDSSANDHRVIAARWLKIALSLAAAIIIASAWAMICAKGPPRPDATLATAANLSHYVARALFISILSFSLVIAIKNYRAERHNQLTNMHRRNALSTYKQFMEGGSTEIANAITLQAMQAVFAPQPTGFGDNSTSVDTHVTELLSAIKPISGIRN